MVDGATSKLDTLREPSVEAADHAAAATAGEYLEAYLENRALPTGLGAWGKGIASTGGVVLLRKGTLTIGKELVLSWAMGDSLKQLQVNLLEAQACHSGLNQYVSILDQAMDVIAKQISEGQRLAYELSKEAERAAGTPHLSRTTDQNATEKTEYTVRLEFSEPVAVSSVTLGNRPLSGAPQTLSTEWTGKVRVDAFEEGERREGVIPMAIQARDGADRPVEVNPPHRLRLDDRHGSIVILVDGSGSMKGAKLENAKKQGVLAIDQLQEGFEIALFQFTDCNAVSLAVPFTTDRQQIKQALSSITARGGTPISRATRMAQEYLHTAGKYSHQRLIILSDGQETCNDQPL